MSNPVVSSTNHPSDETLAAFVDGRLDREAHQRLIEHVGQCEACYAVWESVGVFTKTEQIGNAATQRRRHARRRWTWVVAAAAAMLIVLVGTTYVWRTGSETPDMAAIQSAATAMPFRYFDGRLWAVTIDRPVAPVRRGGDKTHVPWQVAKALEELEAVPPAHRNADRLHALGAAYLVAGDHVRAIEALESAVLVSTKATSISAGIEECSCPAVLNDLSVAYYTKAGSTADSRFYVHAAETAERAWLSKQSIPVAWNRALAFEALGLREKARGAWHDYLRLDSVSEWSKEAERRLKRLASSSRSHAWMDAQIQLASATPAALKGIISRFPAQVRDNVTSELLREWGVLYGAGHESAAALILARAQQTGNLLQEAHGECGPALMVQAAIAAKGPRKRLLAAAHVMYGDAMRAYRENRVEDAAALLARAEALLQRVESPLAAAVALQLSICDFYGGAIERALMRTSEILAQGDPAERGQFALSGQLHWMRGMLLKMSGRPYAARAAYAAAANHFNTIGEADHIAAVASLRAELESFLGRDSAAWQHRVAALQTIGVSSARRYTILNEAAEVALHARCARTALAFQTEAVSEIEKGSAYLRADALMWRAGINHVLGDAAAARLDISSAWNYISSIPDATIKAKATVDANIVEAQQFETGSPGRALRLLDEALQRVSDRNDRYRLAHVQFRRGAALIRLGDYGAADEAYIAGLRALEEQRISIADVESRTAFFDDVEVRVEPYIRMLASQQRFDDALGALERVRARTIRDGLEDASAFRYNSLGTSRFDIAGWRGRMSADLYAVVIDLHEEGVTSWVVSRSAIRQLTTDVPRSTILADVRSYATTLEDSPTNHTAVVAQSKLLFDRLLRPALAEVPRDATLAVVSDPQLTHVPWSSLVTGEGYLGERNVVSVAGSLRMLSPGGGGSVAVAPTIAAVGLSFAPEGLHPLRHAVSEAQTVAALHGSATLLINHAVTKDALTGVLSRVDLAHIASHAVVSDTRPPHGGLVIAANSGGIDLLSSWEIAILPRVPRIVVLAGCRTGAHSGVDASVLSGAFIAAGSAAVVATVYDIVDGEGSEMMRWLHDGISARLPIGEALRAARVKAIRSGMPARTWAAFEVFGDATAAL